MSKTTKRLLVRLDKANQKWIDAERRLAEERVMAVEHLVRTTREYADREIELVKHYEQLLRATPAKSKKTSPP